MADCAFLYPAVRDASGGRFRELDAERLNRATVDKVNPFFLLESIANNPFSFVSAALGCMGPGTSLASQSPIGGARPGVGLPGGANGAGRCGRGRGVRGLGGARAAPGDEGVGPALRRPGRCGIVPSVRPPPRRVSGRRRRRGAGPGAARGGPCAGRRSAGRDTRCGEHLRDVLPPRGSPSGDPGRHARGIDGGGGGPRGVGFCVPPRQRHAPRGPERSGGAPRTLGRRPGAGVCAQAVYRPPRRWQRCGRGRAGAVGRRARRGAGHAPLHRGRAGLCRELALAGTPQPCAVPLFLSVSYGLAGQAAAVVVEATPSR